jgi:UDP-N-acetylglucosamine acyltransferase
VPNIHPTAVVAPSAVIGQGTEVGPYAIIEDHVILGERNKIWAHAFIARDTQMGDENEVHPGATIGHVPQDLKYDPATKSGTRIGHRNVFREHSSVHKATKEGTYTTIGDDSLFMVNSHVAHDCLVGNKVVLVNNACLTGHTEMGDGAIMSAMTGIHQFCRIGRLAMMSALSGTNKDLPPFMTFGGRPAACLGLNLVGMRRAGIDRAKRSEIKQAYKWIYREGLLLNEALDRIEAELKCAETKELVEFIRSSKRGICLGAGEAEDTLRARKKPGQATQRDENSGATKEPS